MFRSVSRGCLAGFIALTLSAAAFQALAAGTGGLAAQQAVRNSAAADQTPVLPEALTPEVVDQVMSGLTDRQARELLSSELNGRAAAQKAAKSGTAGGFGVWLVQFRFGLERYSQRLRQRLVQVIGKLDAFPGDLWAALLKATANQGAGGVVSHLGGFAGLLLAGAAAYFGVRQATAARRRQIEQQTDGGLGARLAGAGFRFGLDFISLLAFLLATLVLSLIFFIDVKATRTFMFTFIATAVLALAVNIVSRLLFAPRAPALRLLRVGDEVARFLHRWLVRFTAVVGVAWALAGLLILTGMPEESHLVTVLITGAVSSAMAIWLILEARPLLRAMILRAGAAAPTTPTTTHQGGQGGHRLTEMLAESWHLFAIVYVTAIWLLWSAAMLIEGRYGVLPAVGSVLVVAFIPLCDRVMCGILGNFFDLENPEKREQHLRYLGVLQRIARGIIIVVATILVLELWGLRLFGDTMASLVLWEASFDIAVALLLAYVGWELVKVGIDRNLTPREMDGHTIQPSSRTQTLLPLIRKFVMVVLVVMTVMIVLSALGIDIGPLLAGAGVVGLAIGFGAQALVRDIVAGVFFLIDDAFRIGEYIEMGELRGEVEGISLRSLKLRHHRGPVHTVPFGELRSITNHNRDWVIYKMSFRVPFETDIDLVKKVFKQVGKEMMADEELGPLMIEPLKSQGVLEIDDSALIIRAKFMCKPREQFILRREAYKRIKKAFADNGIEFARRKVEVHQASVVPPGVEPGAGGGAVLAGAAGSADPSGGAAGP